MFNLSREHSFSHRLGWDGCPSGVLLIRRHNNQLGRGLRQGTFTEKESVCSDPETVLLGLRYPLSKSITTLGNGYLGSRIDEERSKMRYLV